MDRTNPYLLIGILILLALASGVMCSQHASSTDITTAQLMNKNGSTVVNGDQVINVAEMQKVPIFSAPQNLIRPLLSGDVMTVYTALTTGTIPKDVINNSKFMTNDGKISNDLKGPGYIVTDKNGKISIKQADSIVWGYKLPYTYAVKEGDSIKVIENNKTVKTLKESEISNDTVPTDFVSAASLKEWFETAKDGSNITLDYYLGGFNDNRTGIYGKEKIIHAFGEEPYNYMRNYTPGAPVMVYDHNASKVNVSSAVSVVEYLPEYPTEIRAQNAKEFANGWNNTIIPPHESAHGKENVTFTSIAEAEAASGSATHGVCPPGRSLRDAILSLGYPLPVGMSGAEESILYEYRPTIDVLVSNEGDYPIQIVMWTEGESGDTHIYTTIYELRDNSTYPDTSNSTEEE